LQLRQKKSRAIGSQFICIVTFGTAIRIKIEDFYPRAHCKIFDFVMGGAGLKERLLSVEAAKKSYKIEDFVRRYQIKDLGFFDLTQFFF
jgi:hypothetical protein